MIAKTAPSRWTKLAYGFGAVAYGVKDNGFSFFLLLFYSQVIGLDARLVGIAITIALLFDGLIDPIIGYWSDNLRSKWGRRHPFMYASAIPVADKLSLPAKTTLARNGSRTRRGRCTDGSQPASRV